MFVFQDHGYQPQIFQSSRSTSPDEPLLYFQPDKLLNCLKNIVSRVIHHGKDIRQIDLYKPGINGLFVRPNTPYRRFIKIVGQPIVRRKSRTDHAHFRRNIGYRHSIIDGQGGNPFPVIFDRQPVHVQLTQYTLDPQSQIFGKHPFRQTVL